MSRKRALGALVTVEVVLRRRVVVAVEAVSVSVVEVTLDVMRLTSFVIIVISAGTFAIIVRRPLEMLQRQMTSESPRDP